jgi:plastocyanin
MGLAGGQQVEQQCGKASFPQRLLGRHVIPHIATAFQTEKVANSDTGAVAKGESKAITFTDPGAYVYICTPHPWMDGQMIVE